MAAAKLFRIAVTAVPATFGLMATPPTQHRPEDRADAQHRGSRTGKTVPRFGVHAPAPSRGDSQQAPPPATGDIPMKGEPTFASRPAFAPRQEKERHAPLVR